jgi:hypothetical protein
VNYQFIKGEAGSVGTVTIVAGTPGGALGRERRAMTLEL